MIFNSQTPVLNDGVADRTFTQMSPSSDSKSYIGRYAELSSDAAEGQEILVKQTKNNAQHMKLLASKRGKEAQTDADGNTVYRSCTINFTIAADQLCSVSFIEKELALACAAAQVSGLVSRAKHGDT